LPEDIVKAVESYNAVVLGCPGRDFRDWQTIDALAEKFAGRLRKPDDAGAV
jgi:hypothetical protein